MNGLRAFFTGKCPQCRIAKVFPNHMYNVARMKDMHATCPSCKVRFESEPGFFWGAMYFGYAINVALIIIIGVVYFGILSKEVIWVYGTIIATLVVLLIPFNFRFSRLLMMYIAAPYRKYQAKK